MQVYIASEWRKKNVIAVRINEKWRAIGGDIHITPRPPKLPFMIREANQDEYEIAYEQGIKGIQTVNKNRSTEDHVQTAITNSESGT